MSHQVIVPPLDGSHTFVVEQYYVALNDAVVVGQPFALVRSEHWAWDIPATTNGTVSALVAELGSTITVGAPLLEIREQATEDREQAEQSQRLKRPSLVEEQQAELISAQRVRATPVARRMIAEHGLELAALTGTGRGKVVTRADVLALIREQRTGNREQEIKNREQETLDGQSTMLDDQTKVDVPSSIRNLQFSQPSNLPYALTAIEVDLATALATINQHAAWWARRGMTISTTACVAAATVAALGEHRLFNSAWSDDGIILRRGVQLMIEQSTPGGMQTTLVSDAAGLNSVGIARRLAHAAPHEQIEGHAATFVIVEHAAPWWSHALPAATSTAQLGVGALMQQPRVVATASGDQIAVRPTVVLTLAYDARVATQPDADALLCAIKRRLEHLHSL